MGPHCDSHTVGALLQLRELGPNVGGENVWPAQVPEVAYPVCAGQGTE